MSTHHKGVRVSPRSFNRIWNDAMDLRRLLGLMESDDVSPKIIIEMLLPKAFPEFHFQVESEQVMGNEEGLTYPDLNVMKIREDVWVGGHSGRHKFTLAHEIGHLWLHTGEELTLARNHRGDHELFEDSEWQANTFASEFLMPQQSVLDLDSPVQLQTKFNVSGRAADVRWKNRKRSRTVIK